MTRLTIFLLFAFLPLSGHTQTSTSSDSLPDFADRQWRLGIHWVPLETFLYEPRLRFGLRFGSNKFEYILDFYHGENLLGGNPLGEDRPYLVVGFRPEIRFLRPIRQRKPNQWIQSYLGLEMLLDHRKLTYEQGGIYPQGGNRWQFDEGRHDRTRLGLIFKAGQIFYLTPNIYLDAYAGLGGGFRYVSYHDEINRRAAEQEPTEEWFQSSDLPREDSSFQPYVALGIRLGYQL